MWESPGREPLMIGCEKCFGTGALDAGSDRVGVPLTKPCTCQIVRDIVRNLNRGWAGLSSAARVASSPVSRYSDANLYLTATDDALRAHLRHVGLRAGPGWGFKVSTDSDLMTAWLSPASLMGKEILDPDAAPVSTTKATLVDLVEPPELLILRLGVKSARNSAMGEVLLEALYHRAHVGKPTWIVDQPTRRFDPSHIAFSEDALHHINRWPRVALDNDFTIPEDAVIVEGRPEPSGFPSNPMSLSAGWGSPGAAGSSTQRVERTPVESKPKKKTFKGDR